MNAPLIALAPKSASLNRFSGLFSEGVARAGAETIHYDRWGLRDLMQYDAVVFHWPHHFMDPACQKEALAHLARLWMARRIGGLKLVWVAHNVKQHDTAARTPFIARRFIANLDGVIYLSEASRQIVRAAYAIPDRAVELVTVHGAYADTSGSSYMPPEAEQPASLLTFGLVRPYKNLDELARAALSIDPTVAKVTIRGQRYDPDYAADLTAIAARGEALHMDLSDELLSESDLEASIDAAHGVVLPYRDILNSGSAIHALSRGRPVLAPALGSLPELAEQVGSQWMRLYKGTLTPAVLEEFADHVRGIPPGAAPDLAPLSWNRVERDLKDFFERLFR